MRLTLPSVRTQARSTSLKGGASGLAAARQIVLDTTRPLAVAGKLLFEPLLQLLRENLPRLRHRRRGSVLAALRGNRRRLRISTGNDQTRHRRHRMEDLPPPRHAAAAPADGAGRRRRYVSFNLHGSAPVSLHVQPRILLHRGRRTGLGRVLLPGCLRRGCIVLHRQLA